MYTISEIEQMTGVTRAMLIDYEKKGVLIPARSGDGVANNRRLYSDDDIERLKKIVALLTYDFKLKEIKELLDGPVGDIIGALEYKVEELKRQANRLRNLTLFAKFVNVTDTELFEGLMAGPEDLDAFADRARTSESYEDGTSKIEEASDEELKEMFYSLHEIIYDFSILEEADGFAGVEHQMDKLRLWWDEHVIPINKIGYLGFWAIFEDDETLPSMAETIGGEITSGSLQMSAFYLSMKRLMLRTGDVIRAISKICDSDVILAMELASQLKQTFVLEMYGNEANENCSAIDMQDISEAILHYMARILADEELRNFLDPDGLIRLEGNHTEKTERVFSLIREQGETER